MFNYIRCRDASKYGEQSLIAQPLRFMSEISVISFFPSQCDRNCSGTENSFWNSTKHNHQNHSQLKNNFIRHLHFTSEITKITNKVFYLLTGTYLLTLIISKNKCFFTNVIVIHILYFKNYWPLKRSVPRFAQNIWINLLTEYWSN